MSEKMMQKSRLLLFSLLGLIAVAALSIWGCGGTSYDNPAEKAVTTKTATALITAADLKGWIDAGLVNKSGGYDRVVILDVSNNDPDTSNKYNTVGHIPGAQLISTGSAAFMDNTRAEGPFNVTGSMVVTGAAMDTLIQNAGIDSNTTVVFTNNATNTVNVARAYTTFRYWGFAKNRLKVLQGGNAGWVAAGYQLTKAVPTVAKSSFGVAQNGTTRVNTDMRVSLPEMIGYVQGIVAGNAAKVTLVDTVRGATNPLATISSTTDLLVSGNAYTPFDGAIKGSYSYGAPAMVAPAGTLNFKDAATIKADLAAALGTDGVATLGAAGRDATRTFISFCRAGNYASVGFFVLDGIAYYNDPTVDVKWYDGSYGQWNLLASSDRTAVNTAGATVAAGGKLAVGSIWDTTSLMDNLTWNVSRFHTGTTQRIIVDYGARVYAVEPSFAEGNQIETADRAYRSTVSAPSAGGSGSGGGGC
ncbi:selenite/tellurite reduction operon rhodanese-like protein ExtH [Geomonas subterranea]|uniref:selenite/tellurite reduction operon rhodanese-like protein ExtH n=1 Tax=Geomonas subterranea TaxID=2847989 RepID=UPI001CD58B32|nr:selenite/tellurite reduction operon rhodanese-like protein ExtH [Geomonas fuzhouensis]